MIVALPDTSTGRHTMATDTALLPPTVRDAALALHAARERLRTHQRGYDRLRHRGDLQATNRARSEWGLAILEFIEATVTLAEARDHRSPVWAASTSPGRMFGIANPGHARCERAWRDYQEARKTGNMTIVTAARGQWREAFVAWLQELITRSADEGQQHLQEVRDLLDDSQRLGWQAQRDPARRR
jgi:hypothetical protein